MPAETASKTVQDENFPVGSVLIHRPLRPVVHLFYAFARSADDIADSPALDRGTKLKRLSAFRAGLRGTGGEPKAVSLRAALIARDLSLKHAEDLLTAFEWDASGFSAENFDDLMRYCRYSAAPVGRFLLDLHGESRDTWPPADALCTALQLLNHLQDCKDDFRLLDRAYLPADWLAAAGVSTADLLRPTAQAGVRLVLDQCLHRTGDLLRAAECLPGMISSARLRAEIWIILRLAMRLHQRLSLGDPLAQRVALRRADWALGVGGGLIRAAVKPGPDAPPASPHAYAEWLTRRAGSSFYWAMRLLPERQRRAQFAVYAFCRAVDDIADGPGSDAEKRAALNAWITEIAHIPDGTATTPLGRALTDAWRDFGIDPAALRDVVAGVRMDVDSTLFAPPESALRLYCSRVAGAVGRLSLQIYGLRGPTADRLAEALGEALQLTNILRDMGEDLRAGRFYAPAELVAATGLTIEHRSPEVILADPALGEVRRALADRADDRFETAQGLIDRLDARQLRPALVMMRIYRRLFAHMAARGWHVVDPRPRVSTLGKVRIALTTHLGG